MCPLHGGSWREYERGKRLGKVVQEPKGERERPGDGDGCFEEESPYISLV